MNEKKSIADSLDKIEAKDEQIRLLQQRLATCEQQLNVAAYERDYLERIISIVPSNMFWFDIKDVWLGCNNNEAKHLGFASRSEVVGKHLSDVHAPDVAEKITKVHSQIKENCKSC